MENELPHPSPTPAAQSAITLYRASMASPAHLEKLPRKDGAA